MDKVKWTTLTKEQKEALKRSTSTNWRDQIVKYLTKDECANNGQNTLEIYDATRPDRRDISDSKKKHNMASQITYLRDDGIYLRHEDSMLVIIADAKERIYPGAEKWL